MGWRSARWEVSLEASQEPEPEPECHSAERDVVVSTALGRLEPAVLQAMHEMAMQDPEMLAALVRRLS